MKSLSLISIILTIFFSFILFLGIVSSPNTVIEKSITIEAPQSVIWKTLIDHKKYNKWCSPIKKISGSNDSNSRRVIYQIGNKEFSILEKIYINNKKKLIIFMQNGNIQRSSLRNFQNKIKLKALPDGSAEVAWQLEYTVSPIFAKLLNRLFIKSSFDRMLIGNLQSLKTYIER